MAATQHAVGAPRGRLPLTSTHVFPPSRVLHTRPSSEPAHTTDRKSTRLNSSHGYISYAVFCLKKKMLNSFFIATQCTKDIARVVFNASHVALMIGLFE